VGSKVNLERAMAGHGRFGGHFVQVRSLSLSFGSLPLSDSVCTTHELKRLNRDTLILPLKSYPSHRMGIQSDYCSRYQSNSTSL